MNDINNIETREAASMTPMTEVSAKQEWMQKNGFGEDSQTWCVFGDNTYAIKDQLKSMGCKYSPLLKWHSPIPLDVPSGYGMFAIRFDDIMQWDDQSNNAYYLETAKSFIEQRFAQLEGPSLSKYIGQPGQRLQHVSALYKSHRGFMSKYGWTNIYTFTIGDNVLVWVTSVFLNITPDSIVDLSGTITRHEEFRGVKTTRISRCKVVEVE